MSFFLFFLFFYRILVISTQNWRQQLKLNTTEYCTTTNTNTGSMTVSSAHAGHLLAVQQEASLIICILWNVFFFKKKDVCTFHYTWSHINVNIPYINRLWMCSLKRNVEKVLSNCVKPASKLANAHLGSDLSCCKGRFCHIITMIPHILCCVSVCMDLTGLNMAVKWGPNPFSAWTASSCHR